jgi:hypothetical protein
MGWSRIYRRLWLDVEVALLDLSTSYQEISFRLKAKFSFGVLKSLKHPIEMGFSFSPKTYFEELRKSCYSMEEKLPHITEIRQQVE